MGYRNSDVLRRGAAEGEPVLLELLRRFTYEDYRDRINDLNAYRDFLFDD